MTLDEFLADPAFKEWMDATIIGCPYEVQARVNEAGRMEWRHRYRTPTFMPAGHPDPNPRVVGQEFPWQSGKPKGYSE